MTHIRQLVDAADSVKGVVRDSFISFTFCGLELSKLSPACLSEINIQRTKNGGVSVTYFISFECPDTGEFFDYEHEDDGDYLLAFSDFQSLANQADAWRGDGKEMFFSVINHEKVMELFDFLERCTYEQFEQRHFGDDTYEDDDD